MNIHEHVLILSARSTQRRHLTIILPWGPMPQGAQPPYVVAIECANAAGRPRITDVTRRYQQECALPFYLLWTTVTHGRCWGLHREREMLRRFSHWSLRSHSLSLSLSQLLRQSRPPT